MRKKIEVILRKALGANATIHVTESEQAVHGHYATNVALHLGKEQRRNPLEVAQEIKDAVLKKAPKGFFEKIEVAPPGFVNFWISREALVGELEVILKEKSEYGRSNTGKGKKIQVEFVSANPTGPLTLANGRGGFLGDVLANVLVATGHGVEREYYVNDSGNQICMLGKSILAAQGMIPEEDNFYKGEYIKDWGIKNKRTVENYKGSPIELGHAAANDFLNDIKNTLEKKAGIKFDRWTSEEKDIRGKDFVDKTKALFNDKKLSYSHEGATWLKTSEFDDEKDRVIITSDGAPTYFLVDAGHYLETKERGFNGKILILGPDHHGYVKRIQAAAKIVGLENSEILITQAVRLMRGGEEVKMSKRKGAFITFEELIDEVGVDVARLFFLMITPETHLDFDLGLAKERSTRNPVYYMQYALVRCKGILRNAQSERGEKLEKGRLTEVLSTPEDTALLLGLSRYGDMLEDVAETRRIHMIARYAIDLAKTFHNFFEEELVAGEASEIFAGRLLLVTACEIVFSNLFKIFGISKPEKM